MPELNVFENDSSVPQVVSVNRIPDFQTVMLPFMKIMADDKPHQIQEIYEMVCVYFKLTPAERELLLPSGNQTIMKSRVGWARTYLKKAGLISNPQRGIFIITEEGKKALAENPERIDVKFLRQYPVFKEWQAASKDESEESPVTKAEIDTGKTPEELLEYSFTKLKDELAFDLLEKVKTSSPSFFELLVIDLLIKMGYGGSKKEAGQVMGKSGDGGIDGLIKEDKLGLDTIYIGIPSAFPTFIVFCLTSFQ